MLKIVQATNVAELETALNKLKIKTLISHTTIVLKGVENQSLIVETEAPTKRAKKSPIKAIVKPTTVVKQKRGTYKKKSIVNTIVPVENVKVTPIVGISKVEILRNGKRKTLSGDVRNTLEGMIRGETARFSLTDYKVKRKSIGHIMNTINKSMPKDIQLIYKANDSLVQITRV